jgi:peroxiredoxin Q/BCP
MRQPGNPQSGLLQPGFLQPGQPAPAFSLARDGGGTVRSEDLRGQRYLLYFYPKDDTPGCTREACAFRDRLPSFEKLGVPVFGVSADTVRAHDRFALKHRLGFPLLADPEHALIEAYGVWVEKSLYGRKFFGIQRSSFLIDADGRVEKAWPKVSPEQHPDEVLAYLAGAAGTTARPAARKRTATPATPRVRKA